MNYKHLHYFWMVAKEGSIAAAAERLNVTPHTISAQLGLLDDYFGCSLFTKVGRKLELTETGHMALSYASDIFSLGSELEERVRNLDKIRPGHNSLLYHPYSFLSGCRDGGLHQLIRYLL